MAPPTSVIKRAKATKYTKRKRTTNEEDRDLQLGEGSIAHAEGEIQPPKRKGRGPGKIRASTPNEIERPEVWPIGKHEFTCESKPREITAAITRLALNNMPGPLRSFHSFDDKTKKVVELQFLVIFISVYNTSHF